jgi:hypothetical protein
MPHVRVTSWQLNPNNPGQHLPIQRNQSVESTIANKLMVDIMAMIRCNHLKKDKTYSFIECYEKHDTLS